jgi:hypothetical protein
MNLMEVQSRLNKLPPLPESIQYLTAAAQGGNTQVPPFMALARISEINKEMQSAQQAQPPAEPLNQSLPKQALQSMGIGALQQGQQQQGMQQMAQQVGAAQQAVPPGIPQPVRQQQPMPQQAPRPMPQQGAQPVRMAADGGLMGVPVDPRMFEYGSDGIVAFQSGGLNKDEAPAEETAVEDEPGYDAEAELKKLMPQIQALMKQDVRPVRTRAEIEKGLNKDYGVDEGPIGKSYLEGLASLKEARNAERAKQQADIDARKKFTTSRALLDYSDATRGQTGMGGIGALARSRMNATEKFMGEETGLREDAIKQDSLINEAQYKMQALRQAQKDGDIKAEQKADVDLSRIAKDLGVSKNNLMARLVTGNLNLMGKYETAQASRDVAATRAAAKAASAGKPKAPSNEAAGVAINAARLKEEHSDWTEAQINAEALRLYKLTTVTPGIESREKIAMEKDWSNETYKGAYKTAEAQGPAAAAEYRKNWERRWRPETSPAYNGGQSAPAAAPAAKAGTAENPIKIK